MKCMENKIETLLGAYVLIQGVSTGASKREQLIYRMHKSELWADACPTPKILKLAIVELEAGGALCSSAREELSTPGQPSLRAANAR